MAKKKNSSNEYNDSRREEKESSNGYSEWEAREHRYRTNPSDFDLAMMCRGGDDND